MENESWANDQKPARRMNPSHLRAYCCEDWCLNRRRFLKRTGAAAAVAGVSALGLGYLLTSKSIQGNEKSQEENPPPSPEGVTAGNLKVTTTASSEVSTVENFGVSATALLGRWEADIEYQPLSWMPGAKVEIVALLRFPAEVLTAAKQIVSKIDKMCVLITAERDFDSMGFQHVSHNERVSTLLTPAGLPIEGGGSSAVSRFTGHTYSTPVDVMSEVPIANLESQDPRWYSGRIPTSIDLPKDLPPGIYRLRMDFAFKSGQRTVNFNGDSIGLRPKDLNNVSCAYSPPIPTSGLDIRGNKIDASKISRRCYWVLLSDYNSNGYQGVVAQEDQDKVAISPRNLIHDEVILPRFDSNIRVIGYNLEPNFLMDNINPQRNIPWRYDRGEWSVKVTSPDGTTIDLGRSEFVAGRGTGATTKNPTFTSWKPPAYGRYTVEGKGWIEDVWGNRYEGGGTYSFWIAKRMTLATATFQGQPYNVGNRYGRDIAFAPPVPADVTIEARLYVNSDPQNVRTATSTGKATLGGIFGAAQGMNTLPLDAPGEYHARITATYWDADGNLWVSTMRHAGVVYPEDSSIIAHGKKLLAQGKLVDRGEQHLEGYVTEVGDVLHLDHITFPYNAKDAILIASEQQGANKIEPVLTYEVKGKNAPYDPTLQPVGVSNVRIVTSNGLSPEMFPEYITDMAYFYGSAPRPGFMSRFLVAHDVTRAPYWPTSRTNFGGQFGASNNGDMPGDIYRLLGGIVLRPKGQTPSYAGYQASAFILPKGTNNNRVIGPGDEDLPSPDGRPARFYMVPVRPGMVYQVGAMFGAVLQIDPVVSCDVQFTLTAPDGSKRVAEGSGDQYGYFIAKDKWPLDHPGVWVYTVKATWNGYEGKAPGLPDSGGYIFVLENSDAPGPSMTLQSPSQQTFTPTEGLEIRGRTSAPEVHFAAIIPGAVLEQGVIQANKGEFQYRFDPKRLAEKIKTYDIINLVSGKPEIGRIVHVTFFSEEKGANGSYHSFVRVILRGTTAIYVKEK